MSEKLHTYKYLWARCSDRDVIIRAWKKLRKGKTKRKDVIRIEADFDHYVDKMQIMMMNTRPGGDPDLMFTPRCHKAKIIVEYGKRREIFRPDITEQWVHHIIAQVLAPIITRYSYRYSCGSMPGRGSVYGKRELARVIQRKGFKYFAKLDIRHFFNNAKLDVVVDELEQIIDDEWFIFLIKKVFMYFPDRLPLGFYLSQWMSNFMLWRVDREVMTYQPICYIRYADDQVICDNNKRKLRTIVCDIKQMLGHLRLRLKDNWQIARFDYKNKAGRKIGRVIDFMGFVFTRKNTILRKRIMLRTTRLASRIARCGRLCIRQVRAMISRVGWFKHTDTRIVWRTYIKNYVDIKKLKGFISAYEKEAVYE